MLQFWPEAHARDAGAMAYGFDPTCDKLPHAVVCEIAEALGIERSVVYFIAAGGTRNRFDDFAPSM